MTLLSLVCIVLVSLCFAAVELTEFVRKNVKSELYKINGTGSSVRVVSSGTDVGECVFTMNAENARRKELEDMREERMARSQSNLSVRYARLAVPS